MVSPRAAGWAVRPSMGGAVGAVEAGGGGEVDGDPDAAVVDGQVFDHVQGDEVAAELRLLDGAERVEHLLLGQLLVFSADGHGPALEDAQKTIVTHRLPAGNAGPSGQPGKS